MKFSLVRVRFAPDVLTPGTLYVSEEFDTAIHLCACGCGSKVVTPLGSTEWSFKESKNGPTLYPSIGNWQLNCKSHYWIKNGSIRWAAQWSQDQIEDGIKQEHERRVAYYRQMSARKSGLLLQIWNSFRKIFK
jgi:Family of unknown function (DUF6527)